MYNIIFCDRITVLYTHVMSSVCGTHMTRSFAMIEYNSCMISIILLLEIIGTHVHKISGQILHIP